MVTLVFTNRTQQTVTEDVAKKLCSTPATAGRIMDALTEDEKLQRLLRQMMDRY